MSTRTDERVEEQETLDPDAQHAFCDTCYPWDFNNTLPPMVNAVCGAVVLTATIPIATDWDEVYRMPPDVCRKCMAIDTCPVCGAAG